VDAGAADGAAPQSMHSKVAVIAERNGDIPDPSGRTLSDRP
jgi:hypothetical protein